ncbi:MAG: hypothetical protein JNK04_04525, partial [Myxococcales bacterium]|nr:hypothetical protein [Myxococcales bacterium]
MFARVDGGTVSVTLPAGPTGPALLEAGSGGVVVSGITDAASVGLFPSKPFVMQGFVVPEGGTELGITGAAEEDGVTLKLTLPDEVIVPTGKVEETRPCADVSLDPAKLDSMTPVFGSRKGSHLLMSGGLAELALRPDGPRAATLRIREGGEFVHTFDEQGGRTLIGWQTDTALVFGWVRSSRL